MVPLGAILYARDGDGKRLHGDEDVAYAVPLLIFILGLDPGELPDEVQEAFLRGCGLCGLTGEESAEQLARTVGDAYAARPIEATLMEALDAWARAGLLDRKTPDADKEKYAAFLGSTTRGGVLGGGERPAGTIAAGPLARFATTRSSKK